MTDQLPEKCFAMCDFNDAVPFVGWQPNPEQIEQWAAVIREGWSEAETQRRLRFDWREPRSIAVTGGWKLSGRSDV